MKVFNNIGLNELTEVALQIIEEGKGYSFWRIDGEMGAGKTTLIKLLCKALGVDEEVSSPTFSLVNEYKTKDNQIIYHFDFYRINDLREVYDIGYEDYFYSDNLCILEWAEKIEDLLIGENVFAVHITGTGNKRDISISVDSIQ